MKKLFFLLFPIFIQAQNVPIGYWKDYLSYNSANYISEAENKIYCATNGGLFYINKDDNTINRLSKANGLSDIGVKKIAYSEELRVTVIIYENCNVDLIKKNEIINISDIKRKEITGLKSINNITINKNIAYLSTTFGLVLLDLIKEEVKDTYHVGDSISEYEINGCAFLGDTIITATSNGVFFAVKNYQTLSDYNNWSAITENQNEETYDNVIIANNIIQVDYFFEITSISYNNNTLLKSKFDRIDINENNGFYKELTHSKFKKIKYAWIDNDNIIWVADSVSGLLKFENYEYQESFIPEGPVRNDIYSLNYQENTLYMCHGGHSNFALNSLINDGVSYKKNSDNWFNVNYDELGRSRDILDVAVKNGYSYYASWYHGISKMKDKDYIGKYGYKNTNGVLDTTYYSNNRIRISDLKFDDKGNLWGLSSEVNHPLFVKTKNNEWYSFSMNQDKIDLFFDDLIIDRYNQKWGIVAQGKGVFVYNDNNTISDNSDDQYKTLKNSQGQGNLPSLSVYSIAEDLDGEIWVGTDNGIGVFYNPSEIFSGSNFDAQQILIQEGDYGQYLLSEEKVKCIAIDGGNRKWLGTEESGIFLLSADGQEEINHFTKENSPLFSNNIIDISINHNNGEVFIGTEKGLISYRSDATGGVVVQEETHVFPNPVRESYSGPIAIKGLVTNSNIKITDIDGNLFFDDFAKGGQAIWNGKNKNGVKASTGVYLVFSTNIDGVERTVSKILIIR
tara:strand:- start:928 stop:3135 length:2208 start_codon:yes stop_codon:yes gene_type:complete